MKEKELNDAFFNWYKETKEKDYTASILYEKYPAIAKKLALYFYRLGSEDGYDIGRRAGEKAMEKLLSEPKKANNGSVQP